MSVAAENRERQRWEEMMSFGVLVLALVKQPELLWTPALIQRFELTADAEEVDERLCEKFLATPEETLVSMLAPSYPPGKKLMVAARMFAAETVLASWVCRQNVDKGVTPTVGDIIQQRAHELAAMPGSSGDKATSFELSAEHKWSKTFRKRWGFSHGKAAEREAVPLHEIRNKE